ncbi:MAG: TonB-dependent receptor [Candidatus Sphingomonas colombiensis]|nr:TonB-dependent receptor [Sphingomonas sp.]WEK43256.1 MAG: TonB-dependent receptor [Sphingomonas sp.]
MDTYTRWHLCIATSLIAFTAANPAACQQAAAREYHLPSQNLATSLLAIGQQSNTEILFQPKDVRHITAPALNGRFSPEDAVRAIVAPAGLRVDIENGSIFVRAQTTGGDQGDQGEVVVTGTRLRGAPIASPLISLTQRQIIDSGQVSLGDVVRTIPQNFGGAQNPGANITTPEKKGNYIGSGSAIDLRGLGGDATLTLLNGHRLAYSGAYQAIDISAIPIAALDRIEIVADGASALYGSDAVAGVANIILKRDFQGLSTSARFGASTDGGNQQQEYNAVGGTIWNSGGLMLAYDFSHNTPLVASQRGYTATTSPGLTLLPSLTQHNVIFTGHQALLPSVEFDIDAFYNHRFSARGYALTAAGDPATNGAILSFRSRSLSIAPSLKFDLGSGWEAKIAGVYSEDSSYYTFDQAYGGIHSLTAGCYCNDIKSIEASVDGDLVHLPAGAIKLAVGTGYRSIGYHGYRTSGDIQNIDVSQGAYFAFGEMSIPVVSPAQHIHGIDKLNLTAALRYENYAGVASVATPKFGIIYSPADLLDIKASWGKSFKAPTFFERYSFQYADVYNAGTLGGTGLPPTASVLLLNGGNPDLKPERATTWTITAALHPPALKGLSVEISYFNVQYDQRIVAPIAYITQALSDPQYRSFVNNAPTTADVAQAIGSRIFTNYTGGAYDPANVAAIVYDGNVNAASQSIHGVDISAKYSLATRMGGRIQLTADGSYLDSSQRLTADLAPVQLAGTVFNPAHFRGRVGASWDQGGLTLTSYVNYTGPVDDTRIGLVGRAGPMTTLDLSARYRFGERSGLFHGFDISLSALNLLNASPKAIKTTGVYDTPYDPLNYSPVGRFLNLAITKQW